MAIVQEQYEPPVDIKESSFLTPTSSQRSKLRLEDLEVKPTELGYVTQVDLPTRTFFVQFCRFSLDELVSFNDGLAKYCDEQYKLKAHDDKTLSHGDNQSAAGDTSRSLRGRKSQKIHRGDIICARYSDEDPKWYRALVLKRDESNEKYQLLYIDYGDIQITSSKHIIVPDVDKVPLIKRCKFGITCFLQGSENFDEQQTSKLLSALKDKYIMIKIIAEQTKLQYMVSIPANAYNLPFWIEYEPDKYNVESSNVDSN